MVVDLINNARRQIEEGKYDDALARLYRACEMLAQLRLLQKGINSSDVDLNNDKVPKKSKGWLAKSYQLLDEMGDELGQRYTSDRKLQAILNERNYSILAHGCKPIPKETA